MGASFYGPPPSQSPSLHNFPGCDDVVKTLASSLWDAEVPSNSNSKNKVIHNIELQEALNQLNIQPDLSLPENIPLLWIHRRLKEADIYFITNQGESKIGFNVVFRINGMQPEIWDPLTGTIRDLKVFTQNGKITEIPLELDTNGSAFIIFNDNRVTTPVLISQSPKFL